MHIAVQESALESQVKVPSAKLDSNDERSPQLKDVVAAVVVGAAVVEATGGSIVVEATGGAAVVVTTGGEAVVVVAIPDRFYEENFLNLTHLGM